jgi:hypothetical protein
MANRVLIRDQLVDALMEKVRDDPYPSIDMLNSLEALLDPLELEEYAEMLLQKVRNDRYPSWNMIYRLHNIAGRQLQAALSLRR